MQWDNVTNLKIVDLVDFEAQPIKVVDDEAMHELVDGIKTVGVLVHIIVRRIKDGKYGIISGHRRKRACEIAGKNTIPAVVVKLNDDEAAILLVDSNLQREKLLPSERAYAYKLKLEALKHQGIKNILNRDFISCVKLLLIKPAYSKIVQYITHKNVTILCRKKYHDVVKLVQKNGVAEGWQYEQCT